MPDGPICTVCAGRQGSALVDAALAVFRCPSCGHMFTVLSDDKQEKYGADYYSKKHENWFAHPNIGLFNSIIAWVDRFFADKPVALLDVGSGDGAFLEYFKTNRSDARLYGIDVNQNAGDGVVYLKGDFCAYQFDREFDALTGLMVIEHVADPGSFVKKINAVLKSEGIVYLTTINNGSLIYRLARILKKIGIRGPFERLYDHHHLQHYTNGSLRMLMERNGFTVLSRKNHNFPVSAIDVPDNFFLLKMIYRLGIVTLFVISKLFGGEINQTIICKKAN